MLEALHFLQLSLFIPKINSTNSKSRTSIIIVPFLMAVGKSKTVLGANATLEAYFFAAVGNIYLTDKR